MVTCKKCSTENSVDSLFCRKCGAEIADEARVEAQQKLQDLVAEGYRIFNEGRTEEARLIAEAALEEDPRSASALSLKGMGHERAGEIAEALAAYERVVELNPDSALDRIKVTHLRQALSGRALAEPAPNRNRAILGALAAVVLVVAIGIAIGASMPRDSKLAAKSDNASLPSGTTDAFSTAAPEIRQPAASETKTPAETETSDPATATPPASTASPTNGRARPPRFRLPDYPGGGLPLPNGGIGGGEAPVVPPSPGGLKVEPQEPAGGAPAADSGPDPKIDRGGGPTQEAPKKPEFDPGLIDIKVSKPKTTLGGSQDLPDSNGLSALLQTARQQFLLGRHSQAASSYEAALRAGADPASTNQRIGQAYANAGQTQAAVAAYRKAIQAYESRLNGPGDKAQAQAALEACRRALKTLGG